MHLHDKRKNVFRLPVSVFAKSDWMTILVRLESFILSIIFQRIGVDIPPVKWPRLSVQPNPINKWIPASFPAARGSGNRLL